MTSNLDNHPGVELGQDNDHGLTINWVQLFIGAAICYFWFYQSWTSMLALAIVVIIHELGHVIAGKSYGCDIQEMQVFLLCFVSYKPRKVAGGGWWRAITWSLGSLPLGGFTVFDAQQALVNTTDNIHSASRGLDKIAALLPAAAEIIERLDSCAIELDDIEQALTANDISYDPQRLETVSERLDTIYSLQKKYHKANIAELLDMQSQLEQQLNIIVNHEEVVAEKRKQCEALRKKALSTANMLTAARREAAIKVERELTTRLQPLGMPYVDFVVELTSLDELAANGQEKVRFLFSANKSMPPRSLEKIASGGEIARVMLTLKAMLSTHKQLPTIIFDEIDTGVSGRIANEMATVMQQCARESHAQVISITHNPQIAARGDHHYRIYKQDSAQSATTHMELLDANQRVEEIAKMLSGSSVSEAAKTNARDLLKETKGDKRR